MNSADGMTRLQEAQTLLESVTEDLKRFDEVLQWLGEAADRAHCLSDYYVTQYADDVEEVLADDPAAVTPPAADEDSIWEVVVAYDERVLRLLRFVTAELTATLEHGVAEVPDATR